MSRYLALRAQPAPCNLPVTCRKARNTIIGGERLNYKYIWAWEILKGTTSADIVRGIVSLAREENAPARAIMRLHDGRWLTLEDLSNEELVQQIENEAKSMI